MKRSKKLDLKYVIEVYFKDGSTKRSTRYIKDRIRALLLEAWATGSVLKTYIKIIYGLDKDGEELTNEMDAFSYAQADKMLADFTEKSTVDFIQGK